MSETIYRLILRGKTTYDGQKIEEAINEILSLEDEYIGLICYEAFEELKKARISENHNLYVSILEALTEEDLFDIILEFKHSLPKIDKELNHLQKDVDQLKKINLEIERLQKQCQSNAEQISLHDETIGKLLSAEPGTLDRFLADAKPGKIKGFFLRFVRKELIEEAKSKCTQYDLRNSLNTEVRRLKADKERLEKESDFYTKQRDQLQSSETEHTQLLANKMTLQVQIEQLENTIGSIPKAKKSKHVVQAAQKVDEDDELQFSIDL
ncbi:hypothetical protein [Legionella sp. PC997]|uniref:hypothetical protein n=1 Tax=Legionella sp. PC997 TaxID=2755562 RepID=UPI0015FB1A5F|nr:hypothetical protein [Legionella sp. PC997]QMT61584.1 hypothetical protein HBNCFIEN_02988 [Legionella sp. PC997]